MSAGRLTATVGARTQRIVYGEPTAAETVAELTLTTTLDQAHLVMLVHCGLLAEADAARILGHIARLRAQAFTPLHTVPTPRGLYLAYEEHLIAALGPDVGGRLHTARSRNDMKATATAIRLRDAVGDIVAELLRLRAVLLNRARAYRLMVMPVHTHFQAALPITYGYYLLGVALALGRDAAALRDAAGPLRYCPLGAGAAAGSDLPIDAARTAALLGFAAPARHALDAVASRDAALRIVAAAAGTALTLSRLAADLQLWSSAEFGYLRFPDRLVGGSSAMPQKRNAFLLEHVKAKAGNAIGAWTAAASLTRGAPFTNSIEVGTEAVAAGWPGLRATHDAVLLSQSLVSGARPDPGRMRQGAEDGFVGATALANQLVRAGVPFRTAHHLIGAAVRTTLDRDPGGRGFADADLPAELHGTDRSVDALTARQRAGGGPGDFDAIFAAAHDELAADSAECRQQCHSGQVSARELDAAVAAIRYRHPDGADHA